MTISRHGVSIGVERVDNHFYMAFKVVGKLTHDDYKQITPVIESALQGINDPDIDVFVDLSEWDGFEARAMWDDFKLGMKHNKAFRRIAVYGKEDWLEKAAHIGGWFMTGKAEYFDNFTEAMNWLTQK